MLGVREGAVGGASQRASSIQGMASIPIPPHTLVPLPVPPLIPVSPLFGLTPTLAALIAAPPPIVAVPIVASTLEDLVGGYASSSDGEKEDEVTGSL